MLNLLNNFSVRARMYLAISLFSITLLVALAQAFISIGANIEFAEKEKMGNLYQRPVAIMLHDAAMIRSALALSLGSGDLKAYISSISVQMEKLAEADKAVGEALQFTDGGLGSRGRENLKYEKVKDKWTALSAALENTAAAKDTSALLTSFIGDLRGLIAHSGDTSNLILDPDLDSYYLMDVTLLAMPQTLDRLGQIASRYNAELPKASTDGYIAGDSSKVEAAVMGAMLSESDIARVEADMAVSFTEDPNFYGVSPDYKEGLSPLLDQYVQANKRVSSLLSDISVGKTVLSGTFSGAIADAVKTSHVFLGKAYDNLDNLLDLRIASYQQQQLRVAIISLVGFVVSLLFYIMVANSISTPLARLKAIMVKLADQDYSDEVPYTAARSEIGKMAATVQVFKENGRETLRLREERVANELKAAEDKKAMMLDMARRFESQVGGMIQNLVVDSEKLQDASKNMEKNASQTQGASVSVASASEQTSANVATVASATEEMGASAREIAFQVADVAAKANMATSVASTTSQKVDQLSDLVGNIGEVVTAIKDIAAQTNLLALNATIEAARAGETGKGFAVVADEVKKLANETAQKTEEIEARITLIQDATQESVRAMQEIIRNISEIDMAATGTASAVEEQNSVLAEITRNISEVSQAARQVADVISGVQIAATSTGEASRMLSVSSDNIAKLSEDLGLAVENFLQQVRTSANQ